MVNIGKSYPGHVKDLKVFLSPQNFFLVRVKKLP